MANYYTIEKETAGVTFNVDNLSSNGYLLSWFDDIAALLFTRGYDLSHDGEGFIITRQGRTKVSRTVPEMVAVDNWMRLLEDR